MSDNLKSDLDRVARAGWLLDELLAILPPLMRTPNEAEMDAALNMVVQRIKAAEEYAAREMHDRELIGHTSMSTVTAALREYPDADTSRLWIPADEALAIKQSADRAAETMQELRSYLSPRIVDIADRLVASGPKAAHVSASECHELTDAVNLVNYALSQG